MAPRLLVPVLESLPLAVGSGGQVQIRWAGLAWRWPNAKPNLTIGTKILVNVARNAKLSLPSAHSKPAHYDIASKCQTTGICPSGACPLETYLYRTCPCHMNSSNWCLLGAQMHHLFNKCWYKHILSQNWQKADLRALVGRFSSISLDLKSIFSTTNKTCKEMVKEDNCSYKCWHFPAQMSCLRRFCRENVDNGIYALWWAGLTQKVNGGQIRWFRGWGYDFH